MHFSRGPTVTDPLTQYRGKNRCVGIRQTWFQIVVLLLTDCVTLGQLQNLSRLRFLSSKTAVMMPPNLLPTASKHCWEPEMENPLWGSGLEDGYLIERWGRTSGLHSEHGILNVYPVFGFLFNPFGGH